MSETYKYFGVRLVEERASVQTLSFEEVDCRPHASNLYREVSCFSGMPLGLIDEVVDQAIDALDCRVMSCFVAVEAESARRCRLTLPRVRGVELANGIERPSERLKLDGETVGELSHASSGRAVIINEAVEVGERRLVLGKRSLDSHLFEAFELEVAL